LLARQRDALGGGAALEGFFDTAHEAGLAHAAVLGTAAAVANHAAFSVGASAGTRITARIAAALVRFVSAADLAVLTRAALQDSTTAIADSTAVRSLSRTRRGRTVWRRTGATVGRAAATVRDDAATVTTRLGFARRSFGFVAAHASTEIEQHVQQHLFLVRQIPAA